MSENISYEETITKLCAILSDGAPHALRDLCALLNVPISILSQLRFRLPESMQKTLKYDDLSWQLNRSFVSVLADDLVNYANTLEAQVRVIDECTSTNSVLMEEIKSAPDIPYRHVLIAHRQTDGRGRMGRTWLSPAGDGLTFSAALSSPRTQAEIGALPLVAALSCNKVLNHFGIRSQIKWPNDLVIGDKKIAGILTETVLSEQGCTAVIGVGINFYPPDAPDIQAAGVWEYAADIDPTALLKAVLHELMRNVTFFFMRGFSAFQINYMNMCCDLRRPVLISRENKTVEEGIMLGVDGKGALLLEVSGSLKKIHSGEVSLRADENTNLPTETSTKQMLILDCGNSQVKWAWIINREIVAVFRAPYSRLGALGEFCRQQPNISEVYGSTVSGELKKIQVSGLIPWRIRWFYAEKMTCGIRNHYRHVEEHGADRWYNVVGARSVSKNACVVVSCGTAVTVDALSADDQYLGGSILPGFNLMKESLSTNTANLDRPFGRIYPFATTTPNAIASGIMDAVVGAIVLMHSRLKERESGAVDLVLTGGGAGRILVNLPASFTAENQVKIAENLVITGILQRIEQQSEII